MLCDVVLNCMVISNISISISSKHSNMVVSLTSISIMYRMLTSYSITIIICIIS